MIEKASGEPFGSVLDERIFTPLKLTRTAYEPATTTSGADMARGYTSFALADPIPADPEAEGWAGPRGRDLVHADRSADVGPFAPRPQVISRELVQGA